MESGNFKIEQRETEDDLSSSFSIFNFQFSIFLKHIIRKIFLEDWEMKLVALAITLALWFGVTGLSTPTTTRLNGVPLSLRFSNDIEVTNSPIQQVDIAITGDRRKIAQVNKNDLIVSLDLTDVAPGDRVLHLTPENVSIELPAGIKLTEILPSKLPVRLEAVEEKEVPIKVETVGNIPDGYEIYEETVVPARVRVRGPAGFIRSLTFVSTERIDLSDRKEDFAVRQVPISVSNPNATLLENVADVRFRIGEKRVERIFLVPVTGDPKRKAVVVLFGGKSLLDDVKASDLRVESVPGSTDLRLLLPPVLDGKIEIRKVSASSGKIP